MAKAVAYLPHSQSDFLLNVFALKMGIIPQICTLSVLLCAVAVLSAPARSGTDDDSNEHEGSASSSGVKGDPEQGDEAGQRGGKGDRGLIGLLGSKGDTGPTGPQADQGPPGSDTNNVQTLAIQPVQVKNVIKMLDNLAIVPAGQRKDTRIPQSPETRNARGVAAIGAAKCPSGTFPAVHGYCERAVEMDFS